MMESEGVSTSRCAHVTLPFWGREVGVQYFLHQHLVKTDDKILLADPNFLKGVEKEAVANMTFAM